MQVFKVCRLKGFCRDRKKRKIKPLNQNKVANGLGATRICIANYSCNQQIALNYNRLWKSEQIIEQWNRLIRLFNQKEEA